MTECKCTICQSKELFVDAKQCGINKNNWHSQSKVGMQSELDGLKL